MAGAGFDELDLQLIHALQIDGRAPFSRIAEVLGVSDQTVARRYSRLRSQQRVRVTGRTDPARLGEVSWLVRIQCVPSVALTIGQALARRSDTSWVKLTSGGTEIICAVRAATGHDSGSLLLDKLPRTPNVTQVSANCILHVFYGGPDGVVDVLDAAQVARLQPPAPVHAGPAVLDDADRRLIEALRADGRAAITELSAATGLPPTTVRRRMAELRRSGVLYFDVDLDYGSLTAMQTMLWLSVAPDGLPAAGRALAAHAEVPFVAATTGVSNLYATVLSPSPDALFTYLSAKVAELPAVQRVESAPVIRTLKYL